MKYNSIYNKFSSGELSQYLKGRTDLEEYYSGVDEMTNFIPLKQGGTYFRPGTSQVSVSSSITNFNNRIFSFSPSDNFNYIIFASPGYNLAIRRVEGGNLVNCTLNQPTTVWNKYIDFSNVAGIFNPAANGAITSSIFDSLTFTSYGDIFVLLDGTGTLAPIVGKRVGDTTFVIDSILYPTVINPDTSVLWLDTSAKYPIRLAYKDTNIDPNIKMKPSGTTGSITITSENSSATPINYFKGDPVGMYIKITQGVSTGVAIVRSKVSDSVVNAQVFGANFTATTSSDNWEVSSWNAIDGYPKSACFYQGRLYFGGNNTYPDTVWGSLVGNIYQFMSKRFVQDATSDTTKLNYFGSIKETDPFNFTIASTVANTIQWMEPSQTLIVGTTGAEYSISGGQDGILSISNINVGAISSHGSARVQPVKVGSSILFVSQDRKRLLEIPKDLRQYQSATELSSLSEGILEKAFKIIDPTNFYLLNGFYELSYQESEGILWCLCQNSFSRKTVLLSLSIDRTSKVLGWAKHVFPHGSSYANISSILTLSLKDQSNKDFLYLYNNRNNYVLERMWTRTRTFAMNQTTSFDAVGSSNTVCHLDYAKVVSAASDTVSVGTEYNFNTVSAISYQGNYLGDFLVGAGGIITIPGAASFTPLLIGYKYSGEVKTMPIEAGAQFGVAQGSARRGHEISIYIDRSRGGKYKQSKSVNEYPIDELGTGSSLVSKEVRLSLNASPDDNQTILKQDQPYPLSILWMLTKGYTYDT
jgi:hypothetical protein